MDNQKTRGQSFGFWLFRKYVYFINSVLYFRRVYIIGGEKFPKKGVPVVMASSHRNGVNDPIAFAAQFNGRHFNVLARAKGFKEGIVTKILNGCGMFPVNRMCGDGYAAMKKNDKTLEFVNNALCRGEMVLIYPEGNSQPNQTLIAFNPGYVKMAFTAAETLGFEREIFIIPASNYYTDIFRWRSDVMITFDDPVSLLPYYEKYKQDPRAVVAEVNSLIRAKVVDISLDIQDVDNYRSIDFLKDSSFGIELARAKGYKTNYMPEKLLADKEFVAMLEAEKEKNPQKIETLYNKTTEFIDGINELKINQSSFTKKPTIWGQFVRVLGLLIGLPLFIVSIIPTFLIFLAPYLIMQKVGEKNFTGTMRVGAMIFIIYPLFCVITSILT